MNEQQIQLINEEPEVYEGFSFIIPGKLCPNNLVTRHVGRQAVKSSRAKKDQARVRDIAQEAAKRADWKIVEEEAAVFIELVCWNPVGDIDGRQKVILDALGPLFGPGKVNQREMLEPGVVYDNDKRVKKLLLEDRLDWGGPRYEVRIQKMEAPIRKRALRALKFEDLKHKDILNIINNTDALLNPIPEIAHPILVELIPKSWVVKAKKISKKIIREST